MSKIYGMINLMSNYTYTGDIVDNMPHGRGVFHYQNGDVYRGECYYGRLDGFGVYNYKNGGKYQGFFSNGKINGIGTYTDARNVYKGTWRLDKKHGMFYCTRLDEPVTYRQKWINGKLVEGVRAQYVEPCFLQTVKQHPRRTVRRAPYNGKNDRRCLACCAAPTNATSAQCGHVVMCYECLGRCDLCPICRVPIVDRIQLFIS